MTTFATGDRITHAKRGEGEVRAVYPPIKIRGESIPAYGVHFPGAPHLVICTGHELHPAPVAITPATELYKHRAPRQED